VWTGEGQKRVKEVESLNQPLFHRQPAVPFSFPILYIYQLFSSFFLLLLFL